MAEDKEKTPEPTGSTEEALPLILAGAWVRLGHNKHVPEHLQGRLAAVLEAPVLIDDDPESVASPRRVEYQTKDVKFIVRTRDERSEIFECTRAAFDVVAHNGRHEVTQHA